MILSFDKDGFIDNATCPWCVAQFTSINKGPFAMYCLNCSLTYYRNFDYPEPIDVFMMPWNSGKYSHKLITSLEEFDRVVKLKAFL